MNRFPDFANSTLSPLTEDSVKELSQWTYPPPYSAYSYAGHTDEFLLDKATWGTEQFCLTCENTIIGQVACQREGAHLWVGWSMAPALCGQGHGLIFVNTCIEQLLKITQHAGPILLRVAAWNARAIKTYQKAGFVHIDTIQDEIAYSGVIEPFWIMALHNPE